METSMNNILYREVSFKFDRLLLDTSVYVEVSSILDEIVYDIETWDWTVKYLSQEENLKCALKRLDVYAKRELTLVKEKEEMKQNVERIKQQAEKLRIQFAKELKKIGRELEEKQRVQKALQEAKEQIANSAQVSRDLVAAQRQIRDMNRRQSLAALLKPPSRQKSNSFMKTESHPSFKTFEGLSNPCLLNILGCLDTSDILAASLSNHSNYTRITGLFGIKNILSHSSKSKQRERTQSTSSTIQNTTEGSKTNVTESDKKLQLIKAEHIVGKLKKDEIKLFLEIMNRMKLLEVNLGQIQTEKEDLAAKLHGAENVKDFLMQKLKEMEDALQRSIDEAAKATEQAASDHEVIGFLDARTYELEQLLLKEQEEKKVLEQTSTQERLSFEGRLKVVEDMAQLLTAEKSQIENQFKSQRKILVKEVKTLRAQNVKVTAERDAYRNQLDQLKKSLVLLDGL